MRKFGNGTSEQTLYDKAGRVTVKTQKNSRGELLWGEGYVYGSDGKRTATVDNLGRIIFYEYNSKGQLSSVYYPYTQEMINTLKEEAEANGLATTVEAGENRFITSTERADLVPLLNSMQYGLAYNLTSLQIFIKESYAYDRNGNRTSKTTPYGKIEYTYDKENYLLSSGSKGQSFVNYTYDAMGNLLTEESANKTVKYAYNAQNRLIYCEVTDRAAKEYAQTTYAYDAFGRRIIVQDRGEAAIRTLYDGLTFDIIKQRPTFANGQFTDSQNTGIKFDSTGRPTGDRYRYLGDEDKKDGSRYFYLDEGTYKNVSSRYRGERTTINVNGTLAAQTTTEGTDYFSTDLLGSIRSTTDVYGAQKSNYTYDAFGSLVQGNLTGTTDHGYLGKQQDPTSRLYNYGYRDYKPQTARFTTVDPIRDGNNWFIYCNGDPVNFIDLLGLIQNQVSSIYTMQGKEWKDITLKGSADTIETSGCAVICVSNMLEKSPSEINKTYVLKGDIQWDRIAKDIGAELKVENTSFTKRDFYQQASDTDYYYTTFINVNWNDANSDHWVILKGMTTINGKDYYIITPSSDNDWVITNNTIKIKNGAYYYDAHGNNRSGKGWINENGQVLIPIDQVKRYVSFSFKCTK